MPSTEGAQEGLNAWQTFAGAAAIFLTTAAGVLARFVAKKAEPQAAGDTGKHVVLEQATIADGAPFIAMGADVRAIRLLMEQQVQLAEERKEQEEQDAIRDRLAKTEADNKQMKDFIEELRRSGAKHPPGRPLRDG